MGLLDDLEFSDVLFVVGEEEEWIYAHRNVLSDACDYFKVSALPPHLLA